MVSNQRHPYRINVQSEAIDELDQIYMFICQDSPSRAKTFICSLQKKILTLKEFPHRGNRIRLLEDEASSNEVRFIEHRGYLIFYTVLYKEVIVLHITGPGQDWMRLFLR